MIDFKCNKMNCEMCRIKRRCVQYYMYHDDTFDRSSYENAIKLRRDVTDDYDRYEQGCAGV